MNNSNILNEVESYLRHRLKNDLGIVDINLWGGVFCREARNDQVIISVWYIGRNKKTGFDREFTLPIDTPVREMVELVVMSLTFDS